MILLAAAAVEAAELVPVVRVFEIRRLNSDFSPLDGLSFRVDSDGAGVRVSDWLATLARRIPDAYFAQLLTLTPAEAAPGAGWEQTLRRGPRAIRVRVAPTPAGPDQRFRVDFTLLRRAEPAQTIRREGAVRAGTTLMLSGRDFEIPLTRYLSWFREPGDREARGRLYQELRGRTIFLALGITFQPEASGARLPVRLRAPDDSRLAELQTSLVGETEGGMRLQVQLDDEGFAEHTEVLETTLPEVTPRVLGIASGWKFPHAAGKTARLAFRVRAVRERQPSPHRAETPPLRPRPRPTPASLPEPPSPPVVGCLPVRVGV